MTKRKLQKSRYCCAFIFYNGCFCCENIVPLIFKAKLDALPDEAEVVISARVDKSGRIRPERTESEKKRDDIEALVRAEREDLGNRITIF